MPDLSDGVNWSEIDANNNNAPPNGWPEGMMPSGVNDAARADRGAMKRFWDKVNPVQTVTPSGGVWTFNTGNISYPTAYINGEIYRFRPGVAALGGDQFQVNALGPKPILKHLELFGFAGMVSVIAHDFRYDDVQLVYDASLGSAGAFVLLNPFVPISGDGAGGVSVPGNLAVAGDLTLAGSVAAVGGMSINGDLEVFGRVAANGYASRSGTAGPYQTNFWNIQWAGSDGAHLWVDATDEGQIVTTTTTGGIVLAGGISAASLTTTGAISAGGTLAVTGNTTLTGTLAVTGNTTLTGTLAANNITASGTLAVTGNTTLTGNLTANNITANGTTGIYATAGALRSDVTGTALYLPNGGVECSSVTASANIQCNGGRIVSSAGGPSVAMYDTASTAGYGLWVGTGQLSLGTTNSAGVPAREMMYFRTGPFYSTPGVFVDANVYPTLDNTFYCGVSTNAWLGVASHAFVTISDIAVKRDVASVPPCLGLVLAVEPKAYKLVKAPEDELERVYWGFLANDVADAMERAGYEFGGVRKDNGVMGLALNDMLAVLWGAVRELTSQLSELKGEKR